MGLTWRIAWRNIWRHKGKCLVIGVILFIGSLFMTVGNSLISGMNAGLTENIVRLFTGDIVIISNEQEHDNVLFDAMSGKPVKVIRDFDTVKDVLDDGRIASYLPATAGVVFVLDLGADMTALMLLGIDLERYQQVFPDSFRVVSGRTFAPGERGILIPDLTRAENADFYGVWFLPEGEDFDQAAVPETIRDYADSLLIRQDVVLMGPSPSGSFFDVRVPITGIIEYEALNRIWGNYCLVDIESFREAHNYVTGADVAAEIPEESRQLLAVVDFDDLFGDDLFTDVTTDTEALEFPPGLPTDQHPADLDAGSYNLILVHLAAGTNRRQVLQDLNNTFRQQGLEARAVPWQDAVGVIGNMATMVKAALNIFVMCIFFVAIIIIMNTLSMTALERVSELGMMRAIGARKGFLRRMFVLETGMLAFFFGGLGMVVGVLLVYILRSANIATDNEILQLVYGGQFLRPLFTVTDFAIGVLELGIVILLAVLYPLRVVGGIVPLDAVTRE